MNQLAPIAIFAFNRPDHLRRTVEALAANDLATASHVTFFCDGPRDALKYPSDAVNCEAVREIAHNAKGFASVTVVERSKNLGCAASVIDGLTTMFVQHEKLIVIEDDILTSPFTLTYLNEGLRRYRYDRKVFNIAAWSFPPHLLPRPRGYMFDVYATPRFNCWGWASWRDRFEGIDWEVSDYWEIKRSPAQQEAFNRGGQDMSSMLAMQMQGEINAWDIRADYWRFKNNQYGINPLLSYTTNIGMGSGTHCTVEDHRLDIDITQAKPVSSMRWLPQAQLDIEIVKSYSSNYGPAPSKFREMLKQILRKFGLLAQARHIKKVVQSFLRCK